MPHRIPLPKSAELDLAVPCPARLILMVVALTQSVCALPDPKESTGATLARGKANVSQYLSTIGAPTLRLQAAVPAPEPTKDSTEIRPRSNLNQEKRAAVARAKRSAARDSLADGFIPIRQPSGSATPADHNMNGFVLPPSDALPSATLPPSSATYSLSPQ